MARNTKANEEWKDVVEGRSFGVVGINVDMEVLGTDADEVNTQIWWKWTLAEWEHRGDKNKLLKLRKYNINTHQIQ